MFSSRSELLAFLEASRLPNHVLGKTAEAPREFFCIEVRTPDRPIANVGVVSSGTGIKPSWLFKNGKLLVGFDDRVAVFALDDVRFERDVQLLSLFYEFIDIPELHVCVVCETAVLAMLPDGLPIWRANTDLIADYKVVGSTMRLEFSDDHPIWLDLISGKRSDG